MQQINKNHTSLKHFNKAILQTSLFLIKFTFHTALNHLE